VVPPPEHEREGRAAELAVRAGRVGRPRRRAPRRRRDVRRRVDVAEPRARVAREPPPVEVRDGRVIAERDRLERQPRAPRQALGLEEGREGRVAAPLELLALRGGDGVEVQRAHVGDVHAEAPVDAGAVDAEIGAVVERDPGIRLGRRVAVEAARVVDEYSGSLVLGYHWGSLVLD
jgi:hypothetical protein